jgi:hypothetical protein
MFRYSFDSIKLPAFLLLCKENSPISPFSDHPDEFKVIQIYFCLKRSFSSLNNQLILSGLTFFMGSELAFFRTTESAFTGIAGNSTGSYIH